MNRFIMAGIISITLPFGGGFVISSSGGITPLNSGTPTSVSVQGQNPTAVNSVVGSNTSYNWSGYQATGGTFTSVSGTWTVPAVPSATSTEADATWVGIGGVTSRDLIQAGTQAVINGSGEPAYQAWYEMLPATTQQVPLTVSPGDSISASITQTAAAVGNSPGDWNISIRDNTTGQSYGTVVNYNSSLSSAEWIEEMPSDGSSFVPIDNFGTVSFTGGTTTKNGVTQTMSGVNAQELTMVNNTGQALATPSAIGGDGESFSVTRSAAVATSGAIGFGGGSGSGYYVVGRGGLGRGWHRTGVGIQGFTPRTSVSNANGSGAAASGSSSSGTGTTGTGFGFSGGNPWNQLYQIMQQF